MHTQPNSARIKRLTVLGFCLVLPLLSGCIGGQYYGIAALNPYTRQQWREDERMGPTFHQQMARLRDLERAAATLGPQDQQRAAAQMIDLIQTDQNPLIRAAGARVLGEIPTPAALSGLRAAAADADPLVQIAACQALGRRADQDAATALAELASSASNTDVRLAALAALGNCPEQQAVPALSVALSDSNPAIQHRAVQSLKSSTGKPLGESVAVWQAYVHGEPIPEPPAASIADRLQRLFY